MFTRKPVGGNISSANGVIKSLAKYGYNIDILTDDNIPNLKESDKIKIIYLPYNKLRSFFLNKNKNKIIKKIISKIENFIFRFVLQNKVKQILNLNSYEYCYIRASFHAHVVLKVLKKNGIKLILEVNKPLSMSPYNNSDVEWPKNKKNVLITKSEKLQYDFAKVITVDSSLRARWITDFVGNYKDKILINHNGVDIDSFKPSKKNEEVLNNLNFNNDDIVVGVASSFRWYNDIQEMFEIIKLSLKKKTNLNYLLVVGDDNKAEKIFELIDRYNVYKSVKVLVKIPFKEMPQILSICDIFLSHFNFHKKWPHNNSIKHLEYLSMGKPVVATNAGEVNFAVENKINGFLCKEGIIEDYVSAIDTLIKDQSLRKSFGKAARSKAINELSWESNIDRIFNFISYLDAKK